MKDEWKGHETDFPTPVGKIIDLAYCLSLLFGRPVVEGSRNRFPHTSRKIIDLAYCLSLLFGRPVVSVSLTYRPY